MNLLPQLNIFPTTTFDTFLPPRHNKHDDINSPHIGPCNHCMRPAGVRLWRTQHHLWDGVSAWSPRLPEPGERLQKPEIKTTQLLQTQRDTHNSTTMLDKKNVRVISCGYERITTGSHITNWQWTMDLLESDCWTAVKTGMIKLLNQTFEMGSYSHLSTIIVTQGDLDMNANCKCTTTISGGKCLLQIGIWTDYHGSQHSTCARYVQ